MDYLEKLCENNVNLNELPSCKKYQKLKEEIDDCRICESYCDNYCSKMCCNVCCNDCFMIDKNVCNSDFSKNCDNECDKYKNCKETFCWEKLVRNYKDCKEAINLEKLSQGKICDEVIDTNKLSECKNITDKDKLCQKHKECVEAIDNKILKNNNKKACNDICNGLIKSTIILKNENDFRNHCSYLSFWVYETLWKIDTTNSVLDPCASDILQRLIFRISYKNLAMQKPCYFYLYGTFEEWKKMKYLHDYFKNHQHIMNNVSYTDSKSKYCEYVTSIVPLYKDYLRHCCTYFYHKDYWDHCPMFFNCDTTYSPYVLLKNLNCENLLNDYPEGIEYELSIDRYVKEISKETESTSNGRLPEKQEKEQPLSISHHDIINGLIRENGSLTSDPLYVTIVCAYSVLGMFFLFFLFYKFTPLGPLIDRNMHNKKKIKRNFQENCKHKLSSTRLRQGQGSARNKRISITYNSK
ncbi:variable surface protein [Plasmodium gonderi]|uniref:Variable surface protein n=1 Tax=Plasmodium gonderi TaxID=77519 RepID=A0A1Y1JD37_PLAGO|nr:variable surface protein [Plasmodium gonderi]GAW80429.1 variable surface protein [Plasmodium gonderi]